MPKEVTTNSYLTSLGLRAAPVRSALLNFLWNFHIPKTYVLFRGVPSSNCLSQLKSALLQLYRTHVLLAGTSALTQRQVISNHYESLQRFQLRSEF